MHKLVAVSAMVVLLFTGSAWAAPSKDTRPPPIDSLIIKNWAMGQGAKATKGKQVTVHYTGWMYDPSRAGNKGAKFDSSVDRGKPIDFTLGAGQVIKGWDQGLEGMQEGGKRTIIIPPALGYGAQGAGGVIPPNATLMFEVELVKVK